jgi:rhodanese-related sulfurtransferase
MAALLAATSAWSGGNAVVADVPGSVANLSPKEAAAAIRQNGSREDFVLLDVRTPGEYREGHIEGAVLIDYTSSRFKDELERLDRGKTYLVYCRTGNRSGKAAAILEEMRFRKVLHMSGGITEWKKEGLPIAR